MITGTLVAIYIAGASVPVPGLAPEVVTEIERTSPELAAMGRLSIMALGVMPLFNALMLVEFCRLLVPGLYRQTTNGPAPLPVMVLTFLFAIFQSYGISIALRQYPNLAAEPDSAFVLTATATIVGGVALALALAKAITRYGIGNGFWVLLVTPVLAQLPFDAAALTELARTGDIAASALGAAFVVTAVSAMALVALLIHRRHIGLERIDDIVWPPILATVIMGWFEVLLWLLRESELKGALIDLTARGHVIHASVLALLTLAFVTLYALHSERHGSITWSTATLAGIAFAPDLLRTTFGLPLLIDGRWLIVTVAVLFSFASLWQRAKPTAPNPA
ncbi:MAG: hypothetical protein NW216_14495 [Hyphomicrobium sp.]|nr:hypothetical protein [Hyphomicrobium sp.]